jgi:hypothetical protein
MTGFSDPREDAWGEVTRAVTSCLSWSDCLTWEESSDTVVVPPEGEPPITVHIDASCVS